MDQMWICRQLVLSTQSNPGLKENIVNVFGATFLSTLTPVDVRLEHGGEIEGEGEVGDAVLDDSPAKTSTSTTGSIASSGDAEGWEQRISGYVSKGGAGVGRSDNDRQFFFLNGRPVDLPRITRLVNEVWRLYEMKHKPAAILNLQAPPGSYDVNVTP